MRMEAAFSGSETRTQQKDQHLLDDEQPSHGRLAPGGATVGAFACYGEPPGRLVRFSVNVFEKFDQFRPESSPFSVLEGDSRFRNNKSDKKAWRLRGDCCAGPKNLVAFS
jgi:hypothetical protein